MCRPVFFLSNNYSGIPPEEACSLTPLLPRALFYVDGLIFVVPFLDRSIRFRPFRAKRGPRFSYLTGLGSASSSARPGAAKSGAAWRLLVVAQFVDPAGLPAFPDLGRGLSPFRIVFWESQYFDFQSGLFQNRRVASPFFSWRPARHPDPLKPQRTLRRVKPQKKRIEWKSGNS